MHAACFLALVARAGAEPETVHLLTVGNSFANNALTFLPDLAEEAGHTLVVGRANLGGCTLERHWRHATEFEEDPGAPEGRPYGRGDRKRSLAEMLEARPWDVVTIQQVSYRSHDPATYRPFAGALHSYISERAPDAEVLLHQVWAYRADDPRFVPGNAGKEPHTPELMFRQVREANHTVAAELGVRVLPSGDAMFRADTDAQFGYRPDTTFDFDSAVPPAVPDQTHSLHVGWRWVDRGDEGRRELSIDGHHASTAGRYLLGCLWFEVLFGDDVRELTFVPEGLAHGHAEFLREVAHEVGQAGPVTPSPTPAATPTP